MQVVCFISMYIYKEYANLRRYMYAVSGILGDGHMSNFVDNFELVGSCSVCHELTIWKIIE